MAFDAGPDSGSFPPSVDVPSPADGIVDGDILLVATGSEDVVGNFRASMCRSHFLSLTARTKSERSCRDSSAWLDPSLGPVLSIVMNQRKALKKRQKNLKKKEQIR